MTWPGSWRPRWLGGERPDRRSFPQSGGRAALLVPRPLVDALAGGQRCGLALAPLGRISCRESDSEDSPFAPLGLSDRRLGEDGVRLRQPRRGVRRGVKSIGRSPRAGQILPPSQSVQFAPVLASSALAAGSASAGFRPDRVQMAVRGRAALPLADLPSGGRVPMPRASVALPSVISERASEEVPGFGSGAPSLSASKPLRPPRRSRRTRASSASGRSVPILPLPPRQPCWRTKC